VESLRKAGSHVKRLSDNSPFRIDDLLPLEAVEIISEKVMTNCASSVSIPILRPDGGLKGILKLGAVLQRDEFKQNDINRLRVVAEAVANVLQRARAEEAVTASELNYRSIFENAPIGIFQSSAEGKLLSVNERLATMMQFQSASDAVAAINDLRSQIYVNPEDRDNLLKEVLAADGFIRRECDFYRRDGSIFVGGISLRGVKDKEGRFQFLEGFIEDITEAKAVSDSLQRRFEIDKLITGVVAEFASCDAKDVDYSINRALKLLAGAFKSEQAYIVMVSPDGKSYTATHEWCVEDAPKMISVYQNVSFGSIPWTESRIMSDQVINIPDLEKYTEIETPNELDAISASYGRRSTLSVPIHGKAGIIAGMIGMASYSREVTWSESDITKLRIAGDAVAGVIERKRVEEAAQRQSEYDEIIRSTLARFATCAPEDIDASVEQALCHISQCFGGENSYLTLFSDDFKSYSCSHEWMDREYPPSKHRFQNLSFGTLPYIEQQILSDKIVTSNGAEDDVLRQLRSNGVPIVPGGISSLLIVPVHGVAGTIIGMVGLNSYKRKMCWTSKDIDQLRVVGNAIANIIERKKADTALKLNNISLEQRIVARTADLEEARRTAIEIMHDVDEQRRRAEEALAKLEFTTEHLRLLSQAVDNSPAMVMIMDDSRLIEYVNPKFTEVTGYSPSEVLGSDRTLLASDSNEDDGSSELTAALDAGKAWSGEICNRRKSGELFWEYASFAPIKGPDGDVRHYVAVKEDITGRRRMQDELRLARDAAEAANRTKSLFLANMSHEIRTPMNAILGFSQLLQNSRAFVGVEKQHLDIINRSGEHLLALINDILEMSKIEAGRVVLNQNPVDLPSLVSDLSIMFRMRSTDKNIAFALEQIGRLPEYVNTDENKLRQILTNLLGNAVKLTETGGVVLRVSVGPTKYSNYCIIAEVEDTGPGIADHEKSKVFKPFEQTASGIRTRSGTGLGLAISMQFAQMLGGEITFTSTVDIGSIFRLVIPVQKVKSLSDTSHPSKLRVAGLSPKCKVRKVLVVDDELENRILLSSMLNDVGFETNEAVEGASSLALFEEWRPDVILMDAQMPGMDGYEAIRRLRSDPDGKQIPIIAISASAFDDDRQRMLDAGANDFLSKPLRVDSVYSAIASASGASYRYLDNLNADEIPSKSSAESAELKKHAASLPSDIAAKIRQATVDADFDTVITLVDQISDVDRGVADSLRAMAEQYEATRIMNLLSAES
jgi:PAS domain S-box-containing protein